ncbi:hypothetical protein JXA80_05350 [bacterium]|nr:hypothetical protein [candidate division CSSED10-310 bacterium]
MRALAEFIHWFQWYPLRGIVTRLPRRRVVSTGFLMGDIHCLLHRRRRRIVRDELLKSLPDRDPREIDRLVRQTFRQAAAVFLETFCFPRLKPDTIEKWMRLHGQRHIHDALQNDRGIMLILVHFGANQMIMAALGHRGYPINQIGSRPDDWHRLSGTRPSRLDQRTFNLRLDLEKTLPASFIYIDRSMRPVYDCLKRNEIMLLAADGRAGTRFLPAPMAGRIMNLSAGPFRIAHATGAPLIPVFPVRDADGVHDLYIEPPITPPIDPATGDTEQTPTRSDTPAGHAPGTSWPEQAAWMFGERLSQWVQRFPDHYAMLMAEAAIRSRIDPVPLFEDMRHE